MKRCVECKRDVLFLSDVGAEPGICGYCRALLCPLCTEHKECSPKIAAHNRKVRKREIDAEIARLKKERKDLG